MLVYERVQPVPIEDESEISDEISNTNQILQKIWIENMEFFRDLLFFDPNYFEMVKSFVKDFSFDSVTGIEPHMSDCEFLKERRKLTEFLLKDKRRFQMTPNMIMNDAEFKQVHMEARTELMYEAIQENEDYGLKVIKLATLFAYEMLIRAKNLDGFKSWVDILDKIYQNHAPACLWFLKFLDSHRDIIVEILFYCRDQQVRFHFANLISHILSLACQIEKEILFTYEDIVNIKELPVYSFQLSRNEADLYEKIPRSVAERFTDSLLQDLLGEARRNWRRFDEYFLIIKKFITNDQLHSKLVCQRNGIRAVLKFFMNGSMPFPDKYVMGDQTTDPDFSVVLEVLGYLVCSSLTQAMIDTKSQPLYMQNSASEYAVIMDSITVSDLQDYRVCQTFLRTIKNETIGKITLHLS